MPRLDNFDGSNSIVLVSFLHLPRSAMNALRLSKGAACMLVSWFLDEPPITVYLAYALSEVCTSIRKMVTWSKIVSVLLQRYLDDMVLTEAYHRDMDAPQRQVETEEEFFDSR